MAPRNHRRHGHDRSHKALLIGVSDYIKDFDPLIGPMNDVKELGDLLGRPPLGFYDVKRIRNPADEMASMISEFLEHATSHDDLIIYYSGHGAVDDFGKLYLTHTKSRGSLRGSSVKYDDFNDWVLDSKARSVLVVLDCCRAGKAGTKGSDTAANDVREALSRARTQSERVRVVLAAVPAHLAAEDGERPRDMSPFTERLVEAIRTADPRVDGVVDLQCCITRLGKIYDDADLVRPVPAGSHRLEAIELVHRPDFAVKLLEREGLTPYLPQRNGSAMRNGVPIVVPTAAAKSVFSGLEESHPTALLVGGKEGSGKTWLLCEVVERVHEAKWAVYGFRPSGNPPSQPASLVAAVSAYLATRQPSGYALVVVDGIEWSEEWRRFIEEIGRIVYEKGVSLLVAVEGLSTTEWKMPGATTIAAPGTMTGINGFIRDLLAGDYYPELSQLPIADRQGLASELKRQANTDLWAAVHLAPLVMRPDGLKLAGERLWRDRVGNLDDPSLSMALWLIAALSVYGIWAPIEPLTQPGVAAAQRLGADVSASGVRINSVFVNRALLARITEDLPLNFNWKDVNSRASQFMHMYITTSLQTIGRHKAATAALARLKLYRHGFDEYVTELAESPSFSWQTWEAVSPSVATVAETLLVIGSRLPPKTARILGKRLAERIEDGQLKYAALSVVLDCLQVLRTTPGMQNVVEVSDAVMTLQVLVEERLKSEQHGAEIRIRALRLVHRFGNADAVAALSRLGPQLITQQGIVEQEDLRVLIELARLIERSGTAGGRALRSELSQWPEAIDLVQKAGKSTPSRSAGYLARWIVAARIVNIDTADSPQEQRLLRVLRSAAVNELRPIVEFCLSHHPTLAYKILDTVERDKWLRRRLPNTAPADLADWMQAFGRYSPRRAAMQLRSGPNTLDRVLLAAQEKALRSSSDSVACSRLLSATARIEDQAGLLETGFAAALATRLGMKFLALQLVSEHRSSVMAHLVTSFLQANAQLDDQLIATALSIVSEDVRTGLVERGSRLALALANASADGQQFLEKLRGSASMRRHRILDYMKRTRDLSTVPAVHRLGVLLYPDIAAEYREWLDEGDLQGRTFLRDVREGMDPVPTLVAAAAIAETLRNAGDIEAGRHMLGVLDQRSQQGDWSRQILQSELWDLPQALSVLNKLSPIDASRLIAGSRMTLFRKLSSCTEMPSVFFALLHATSRSDGATAGELIDMLDSNGMINLAIEHLGTEVDLFTLIEVLRQIVYTRDRTSKPIVPDALLDELFMTTQASLSVLTNPRAVARLLESLAIWRRPAADRAITKLRTTSLRMRFNHRRQEESKDTAHLADVMFDLDRARANDVLDDATFAWLLAKMPLKYVGNLVEIGLRQFPGVETVQIVGDRFADIGGRPFIHDMWEVCSALGDAAWVVGRFGPAPLEVAAPADVELITRLPSDTVLHALAWLSPSVWRDRVLEEMMTMMTETKLPSTPKDAATRLAAVVHLGWSDHWDGNDSMESLWQLALAADAIRLRPLISALAGMPLQDRWVIRRFQAELEAARARLRSGAASWRRHARETLDLLDQILGPSWMEG